MSTSKIPAQSDNSSSPLQPHVTEVLKHNIILSVFLSSKNDFFPILSPTDHFHGLKNHVQLESLSALCFQWQQKEKHRIFVCLFVCLFGATADTWCSNMADSFLHQRLERWCFMVYFLRTAVQWRGGGRCYPVRETITLIDIMSWHSKYTYIVIQGFSGGHFIFLKTLMCTSVHAVAVETSSFSYSVFKVGQVGVPPEAHDVDVHDAELRGEVIEVDCLCQRPHAQVHLRVRTKFKQQLS